MKIKFTWPRLHIFRVTWGDHLFVIANVKDEDEPGDGEPAHTNFPLVVDAPRLGFRLTSDGEEIAEETQC